MRGNGPLRVCLDARLKSGASGGIEQVILGLASGLSRLGDGEEEYLFLAEPGRAGWLRPFLKGPCRLLTGAGAPRKSRWRKRLDKALAALSSLAGREPPVWPVRVPRSDGTVEASGAHVMHFTKQNGFLTEVPSIYHPHDLQHVHLPQFFEAQERAYRDVTYRVLCHQARLVAVSSSWCRQDVAEHYGIAEDRVQVVPLAPPLDAYPVPSSAELGEARAKFALPESYLFYPAQTWPHKNHLGLLDALSFLREREGLTVPFVFSGRCNSFFPTIQNRVETLGLGAQVTFVGFVEPVELQCLYRLSRGVVLPTRFEAGSFPMWEAFFAGVPVASSNVTSLPRQAGDAAFVFDPDQPAEIAKAIRSLWTDEALGAALVARGRRQVGRFSWDLTARIFRAHYRRLAGRPLSEADRGLLAAPPLL